MTSAMLDGASDDVSTIASTGALPALALLLLASAIASWWLGRRSRPVDRSATMWFAALASTSIIVAVTLFRDGAPTTLRLGGLTDWSRDGWRLLSTDPLGSSQFLLNVVLFIPAGLAWTLLLRRPLVAWLALAGASLAIEVVQAVTYVGAPDIADAVANSIGAMIGLVSAVTVDAFTSRTLARPTRRARVTIAGVAGAIILLAVPAWFLGASRHQQSVEDELRAAFEGTDRAAVEALIDSDPEEVFGAIGGWADGTWRSGQVLEIRYPAAFFGLQRCVFVRWDSTSVEFRRASGEGCTELISGGV
jgi:Glycopeptide antibiotics resistance protein